jgi:hypothetical protein
VKCDDFLPRLATGGWFGRLRARRHARSCARCAAAALWLQELKAEQETTTVPAHLRQAWLVAGSETVRPPAVSTLGRPTRRWAIHPAWGAFAVVCVMLLVGAVGLWQAKKDINQADGEKVASVRQIPGPKSPGSATGEIVVIELDAARQLDWLGERTMQLTGDLEKLVQTSQKREVEQAIDAVLATHGNW